VIVTLPISNHTAIFRPILIEVLIVDFLSRTSNPPRLMSYLLHDHPELYPEIFVTVDTVKGKELGTRRFAPLRIYPRREVMNL